MDTGAVTLFLALLAVAAELGVAALIALAAGSRVSPSIADVQASVRATVGPQALWIALLVAGICTGGSLYLSEVAHFLPCRLCWYQRAAMYPLVPILAMSAWRQWFVARWAVLAIALTGGSISAWHLLIEHFPTLEGGACDPNNPCSLVWFRRLGYLTIPAMALSGFALIAALMLTARPSATD